MMNVQTQNIALPEEPFRGIESFRYVDQEIFFAREDETLKLLRNVTIYRGVLFYGDSGSGKSSLINAGFIPVAISEDFIPDRVRVQPRSGKEIIVERISMNSDGKPPYLPSFFAAADETNEAVSEADGEGTTMRVVMSATRFKEELGRMRKAPYEAPRPLLIFDQFEEFITLFEEAPRSKAELEEAQKAQQEILRVLVDLIRDNTLPIKLLFVFREDYLAKMNKLFVKSPELKDQYLRLTPPGLAALHQIISGPFIKFPGHFKNEFSEELSQKLTAALEARSESDKLNLSEVQIACQKLWRSDNPLELISQENSVQRLLEAYLADAIEQLPENLRDSAVAMLSRMVTPSGTRNIVSEDDLIEQVHEDENIPEETLKAALKALVQDVKLVRRERRYDTFFYDIVSEFLVSWIARKRAERLAQIEGRKLKESLRLKRKQTYRIMSICVAFALSISLVSAYIIKGRTTEVLARADVAEAHEAQKQAESARNEALMVRDKAENMRSEALRVRDEATVQKDKALSDLAQMSQAKIDVEQKLREAEQRLQAALSQASAMLNDVEAAKKEAEKWQNSAQNYMEDLNRANARAKTAVERYKEEQTKLQSNINDLMRELETTKRERDNAKAELEKLKSSQPTHPPKERQPQQQPTKQPQQQQKTPQQQQQQQPQQQQQQ